MRLPPLERNGSCLDRKGSLLLVWLMTMASLGLAACSGGGTSPTTTEATTTTAPSGSSTSTSGTTVTTPTAPVTVSLYWVRGGQWLGVSHRSIPATRSVGSAAVDALFGGTTGTESSAGLASVVPAGSKLLGLSIAGGIATANFNSTFASGGGSFSTQARIAQVVFTLTQFPAIQKVLFQLNGVTVSTFGGEGLILNHPLSRSDEVSLLPPIFLESPAVGDTVRSSLHVTGLANTYEATFQVQLVDATGRMVVDHYVMATAGTGTWGTFDASFPYTTTAIGTGKLVVFEISAKDRSHVNEVDVPLTVRP
jgi:germination protein M